ncbi:MAG: hypothetical protein GY879_13445 [Planctomycetes bacterium]|nr:hypothetical protein [Planctomycetota bacterium]MCP4860202.1 hypothetical protein [Planctomycetota bacterium]
MSPNSQTLSSAVLCLTSSFLLIASGHAQGLQEVPATELHSLPVAHFAFEENMSSRPPLGSAAQSPSTPIYIDGLIGKSVRLRALDSTTSIRLHGEAFPFQQDQDFSVMFWVRSTASDTTRMVLLAHKQTSDASLAAQKQQGWQFSMAHGTWAWSLGSGDRRLSYDRDNGEHMPLNDGRWHQLAMTYDHELALVRLYYDGTNPVSYAVGDSRGFDFGTGSPLTLGWPGEPTNDPEKILPAIEQGARALQDLVDAYQAFELAPLQASDFVHLIVEPKRLFEQQVRARGEELGSSGADFIAATLESDLSALEAAESALMRNPYTVHQALTFMEASPLLKIYELVNGKVIIKRKPALHFSAQEQLHGSDFDADELKLWKRALSPAEIRDEYGKFQIPQVPALPAKLEDITVGVWNIFHGGKHFNVEEHGWDSRVAIAQILEREGIDLVMMQETYSSGDFIAAELGFTYATTIDWDYLNQGSNLSVLSRFPILEVKVPPNSPFMNVGVKVAISETQNLWAMSNWYGMSQFEDVYSFHEGRFQAADKTPVLFGGDFNAVPHTDGGNSPASRTLLDAGFTDAFRETHPDVAQFPGFSHREGSRIDQLYYRGASLRNRSTHLIHTWPLGFPSDHYLIVTKFGLE